MENLEIRSFGGEASPKLVSERTIEGYAVVVGQESKYMYCLLYTSDAADE